MGAHRSRAHGDLHRCDRADLGHDRQRARAPVERWGPANPTVRDQYRYDSRGNLSSYTTRAARTGQVQHDALGRVTQISASDAPTITITYESAGKWVAYSNSESTDTVFVDGTGRVAKQVAVRGHAYALTSTFGVRGNREKLRVTSPTAWSGGARELMFGVDTLGRPTMLSDFGGAATAITYNQDHQPYVITVPTKVLERARLRLTHAYRPNERLDSVTSTVAPALLTWRYQYDSLARTRRQEWGVPPYTKRRVVEYDGAGRVYHWTDTQRSQGTPVWVCDDPMVPSTCHWEYPTVETVTAEEWRTFDLVGNRTDGSAVLNPGDRLLSFNGFTMAYDDDGNLVSKSGYGTTQTFAWSGLGQLTSVTTNGVVTSYGYDGLGRRVRKTVNGAPTRYLYDGDNLVMQLDAGGSPVLEFSYYPGIDHPNAVTQLSTGKTFYYVLNASNNVIALVDTTNTVVNQYEYAMSGQAMVATEQVVQPFKFGAREYDAETGLYYNRARYYDPSLTRFISEDPLGFEGGLNLYTYAGNNPVNLTDPSGMKWICANFSDRTVCIWELEPIVVTASGGLGGGFGARPRGLGFGSSLTDGGQSGGGGGGSSRSSTPSARSDTPNKFASCFLNHYELGDLATRGPSWLGAVPIEKAVRELPVFKGASGYTNVISYAGLRLAPGLKTGTRILGTTRVAGILGRANVLVAVGLGAYDATSIGLCSLGFADYQ